MTQAHHSDIDIQYLKGIGPKRAEILSKYNIRNVEELIDFFPRTYFDRRKIVALNNLEPNEEVTVIGKIEAAGLRRARKKIFYIVISDQKGILEAVWFNAFDYFQKTFKVGEWVALSGKVQFYRGWQLVHPDYDRLGEGEFDNLLNTGKILAIYPGNEAFKRAGLNSYLFRRVFSNAQDLLKRQENIFPNAIQHDNHLLNRGEAYKQIHLPDSTELLDRATYYFKYEDFFQLQLMLAVQRAHIKNTPQGISFNKSSPLLDKLYKTLPFKLTDAQKKVMREIRNDMKATEPMNRLLQGDVGSGKTLVAMMAMLIALDNGYQASLMVPTEILAEQHYYNFSRMLKKLGVKVHLLTGSSSTKTREAIASELNTKKPQIVIGTHALIQKTVGFKNLGLVIIDEQHRFGVEQRGKLVKKGIQPDVLVMTATPIPRTLALTVYGSLDTSVIDEMPANRHPIKTVWRFSDKSRDIYTFINERVEAGEQAYIVYPLVEESEKLDLAAATEGFEELSKGPFKKIKTGLLHGRLKSAEKERIMEAFVKNEIQVLVSTTVIEVGVDIANATVMLIEHAERFGLSQLHQLRGRVGRGEKKSYCILKTLFNISDIAQIRMKTMTETNDGFIIAERDLELRGWGDFFGTKQSGMPDFRLANPIADRDILEKARRDAFALIADDSQIRRPENAALHHHVETRLKDKIKLSNIS